MPNFEPIQAFIAVLVIAGLVWKNQFQGETIPFNKILLNVLTKEDYDSVLDFLSFLARA